MSESKDHLDYATELFRSLGCKRRILILRMLHLSSEPLPTMEIADKVGVTGATTSHHLQKLQEIGLVHVQADGGNRYYSLSQMPIHRRLQVLFPTIFPDVSHLSGRSSQSGRSDQPGR